MMSNTEIYEKHKHLVSNVVGWDMFVKNLKEHGKHYIGKDKLIQILTGKYKKTTDLKLSKEQTRNNVEQMLHDNAGSFMCSKW